MGKKILQLFFLFNGLALTSNAQYFSTGQDPASFHWRQIRTREFQLIFPGPFEKKAQYLANIMDLVSRNDHTTLTAKISRIPVILHTQSTISNGITTWAPKRIELYPCPPQDSYPEEWLEQLAIHEYRHTVQIQKINHGFSHVLSFIFGEQVIGGILGLYVPSWLLEGDAVSTETALSKTGRGRSPLFESTLRAQLLEKGKYSYDKAVLGSYRTFVPDQYSLGYYLVSQARKQYGTAIWNSALDRVAKIPVMVVPFSSGIHKITGLTKTKLYKESLAKLDSSWREQANSGVYSLTKRITHSNHKNYSTYSRPCLLNDSTIITKKSSVDDIDRIVRIDRKTGIEKKIVTPGNLTNQTISVSGNLLAWAEYEPHERWQNKDYSIIRVYDLRTKRIHNLTRRTRYFAPAISPDGKQIATVYISPENMCSVYILDIHTSKVIRKFPMPEGELLLSPDWSPDGKKIVFTRLTFKGGSIALLNLSSGSIRDLTLPDYSEKAGQHCFFRNYILFNNGRSGIANIFAVDTASNKVWQVSSVKFGALDPVITQDGSGMIFSDYSSDGMMVAEMNPDPTSWIPENKITDRSIRLYESLASQERSNLQDSVLIRNIFKMDEKNDFDPGRDSIKGKVYPVKKYSKILHLFNPHSWAPAVFNASDLTLHPGISVLSQNPLSTMISEAGYDYNIQEQTGKIFASFSYQGLYPVFNLTIDHGNRASFYELLPKKEFVRFTWQETNLSANISIPWNFSYGRSVCFLQPSAGTTLIYIKHNPGTPPQLTKGIIQSLDYRVYCYQYRRTNPKDMFPFLGQVLDLNYRNCPFSGTNMGSVVSAEATLYFPGILKHHGIRIYGAYQQRTDNPESFYSFSGIVRYPRGFLDGFEKEVFSFSGDYKLPLFYPDFSAGSVAYLKRFKLDLFYDFTEGGTGKLLHTYRSTGAELTTDLHLLRFVFPFELGVRCIYFPDQASFGWEFLYAINF